MPDVHTDLRIHYRVVGDGPPVLWHTGGCGDGRMWELGGYLASLPGYSHVLMDHRGHGGSEGPPGTAGHHMSRYVADVEAVLDDVGADHTAFVGYSFGGVVGYTVAAAAPDRLTGLVALDSAPDPVVSPDAARAYGREVIARGTRDVIEQLASSEDEPPPPWMIEHLSSTEARSFAGGLEAEATRPDLWAAAASMDLPVLLVIGTRADDERRGLGRGLVAVLPRGELVELPVAHLAAFHRIDLTVPPIRAFLDRVSGRM